MNIGIVFATLTGNTQMVAEHIAEKLNNEEWLNKNIDHPEKLNDIEVLLIEAFEVSKETLEDADLLFLGVSSWGGGDQNAVGEEMLIIMEEDPPDFAESNTKLAYFGLGESHYENFCGAIDRMQERFEADFGAEKVGGTIKLDGFPDEVIMEEVELWLKDILNEFLSD